MRFAHPLIKGILLRRYKRFLADIRLENGSLVTAHTANTGAMTGCSTPGARVWLSDSRNPRRKYPLTWELVESPAGGLIGINTLLSNHLVKEAILDGVITPLQGYQNISSEVRYGNENSRIDLMLEDPSGGRCFVEVKNVTLADEGTGKFPDAVSARGSKHLRELMEMGRQGHRAVLLFCVQREDVQTVSPADEIDPLYGTLLRQAGKSGVEIMAYGARVSLDGIKLYRRLPITFP